MDKITKAREILGDDFVIVGIDNWNANVDDYKRILQRLERYETLIKEAKDKSQILATHCAYCADSGRGIDAQQTFEKTQDIYELLRDGLEDEIT